MAARRGRNELAFRLCMRVEAIIPVHQMYTDFPWPVFFYDSGENIAKRAGKRDKFLCGRTQNFFFVRRWANKVSGNGKLTMTISLLESFEKWGMFSGLSSRSREEGWERGKQTYLKSLDDSMVVKAVDGVENGADDGDGIVLGRLALCEDAVKGLCAGGKLKRG